MEESIARHVGHFYLVGERKRSDDMLKLEFTKNEVENIKSKVYFSEMQERIFEYRLKEYSITKMAMLENCSESTINREIKKIKKKIMRVIWLFFCVIIYAGEKMNEYFLNEKIIKQNEEIINLLKKGDDK